MCSIDGVDTLCYPLLRYFVSFSMAAQFCVANQELNMSSIMLKEKTTGIY